MNFKKSLYPIAFFAVVIIMLLLVKSNSSFAQDNKMHQDTVIQLKPVLPADMPVQPLIIVDKAIDSFPNGCVSCHINTGKPNEDYRLITVMAKIPKHPKLSIIKVVPDDCKKCHSEGKKIGKLSQIIHKVHFEREKENSFLIDCKGMCINCHSIDKVDWKMKVKSGEVNW